MQIPCVVKDHNAKTAIVTRAGRKYIYVVHMKSGKLTVKKYTEQQMKLKQFKELPVSLESAIDSFLSHSGGLTDAATQELQEARRGQDGLNSNRL